VTLQRRQCLPKARATRSPPKGAITHQSTAAKGSDEQTLFRRLLGNLADDDVLLGDAYFPT